MTENFADDVPLIEQPDPTWQYPTVGALLALGERLEVEVKVVKEQDDGSFKCRGTGLVRGGDAENSPAEAATAVSGRFTMRPVRTS